MDEFAKESDLRGAVRKSWATPLQPTEAARGMSQKPRFTDGDWSEWERDFGVMLEAAQRVRSAEGVEDRTRATTDYAKAAMKVRTRPKYAEMFNPEIQSTDRQDSVKKFDSRHNALAIRKLTVPCRNGYTLVFFKSGTRLRIRSFWTISTGDTKQISLTLTMQESGLKKNREI